MCATCWSGLTRGARRHHHNGEVRAIDHDTVGVRIEARLASREEVLLLLNCHLRDRDMRHHHFELGADIGTGGFDQLGLNIGIAPCGGTSGFDLFRVEALAVRDSRPGAPTNGFGDRPR